MSKIENGSFWECTEISNTGQKIYNAKNVYYIEMYNDTAFAIIVTDKNLGVLTIPAGTKRVLPAHPLFTVENVNFNVEFNAAAPPTDFLTIIATKQYGINTKNCNHN